MTELVNINISDTGVADVRWNRPEKHNGLSMALSQAIIETAGQLAEDKSLRAVVISGEGASFCAGLDFADFMSDPGNAKRIFQCPEGDAANMAQQMAMVWRRLPVPVIAAIHGNCFGGGLQIALGADIRIAAADARLSVMEIKYGLIPDMAITATLRHLVSIDVAKELTWSGRILTGSEAHALGLISHVADDPHNAAMTLASEFANKSPDAIRQGKRLFNEAWDMREDGGLRLECAIQQQLMGSPNQMAAVQSAMTKQPAQFTDPE